MKRPDPYGERDLKRLQMFITLIPIVGFFPALWALYRQQGSREQRQVCRLVVTLAMGWIVGYVLLAAGIHSTNDVSLLIMSSLLTSGYFLINIWLMVRLWQRKSLRVPGVSQISDRLP